MNDIFQEARWMEELARWAPAPTVRTAPPAAFRQFREAARILLEQVRYLVLALPCPETPGVDSHSGQWEIINMLELLEQKMDAL